MRSMTSTEDDFAEALHLRDQGALAEAAEVLGALHAREPEHAGIRGMLAATLFEAGQVQEAIPHYEALISRSPDSELASVGLFHCYLAEKRIDDAFREMRRYLARKPSKLYDELLRDINAE
jgi:predicted Zn-dependent protease